MAKTDCKPRVFAVNPPVVFPKPARRDYRGSDNPKARKPISSIGGPMILEPRDVPMVPSSRSRRVRRNAWKPAR